MARNIRVDHTLLDGVETTIERWRIGYSWEVRLHHPSPGVDSRAIHGQALTWRSAVRQARRAQEDPWITL